MLRKHYWLLTIAFSLTSLASIAQCSDWEQLLYYSNASIHDVARDRFGNQYVVGGFYINNFSIGGHSFPLPPAGIGAFIAKFDHDDNLVWVTNPTTAERAVAEYVEIDKNDNIVIAGYYYTSVTFGCITLPGSGRTDIFVVNYTRDGDPVWATRSTGVDDSYPTGLTMSPNGNSILIATFVERSSVTPGLPSSDMSLGGVPVITGAVDQVNAGYDSFVASIRPDGTVAWTQGIGGNDNLYDYAHGVATDSEDNVIVTGYFSSAEMSFDGKVVHSFTLSENYFLAKIDPNGETLWVREGEVPVDQGGWGVDTDEDDNIFVAGRFYGDTKFGAFNLVNKGEVDVFVIKIDPDGTTINATAIGNDDYDAGTDLKVDSHGRVLVSAYYYSDVLDIGPFSVTEPHITANSFVATLSNDLSTVECVNFVTGDAESIIWKFEVDPADNAIAIVDRPLGFGTSEIGSSSISDPNAWSVAAFLGDNPPPDVGGTPPPLALTFSLGNDMTICEGETVTLSVNEFCNAQYQWNTGSTARSIDVTQAGIYWVDVKFATRTIRDEIEIFYHPATISLGKDTTLCKGQTLTLSVNQFCNAHYQWSTGSTATSIDVTQPGIYWVDLIQNSGTIRDEIEISYHAPIVINFGDDIDLCPGESVTWGLPVYANATYEWNDGDNALSKTVTTAGTYSVEISNLCETVTDNITVTTKPAVPIVALGDDVTVCEGNDVVLSYSPLPNETFLWSDGSIASTLSVTQSGTYALTVSNGCGEASDEVEVMIKDLSSQIIPNVVTFNGDEKNERFIVPLDGDLVSLLICNRWGERIFYDSDYQNDWPHADVNPGVYFYTLRGGCLPETKGTIHLIR